MYLIDDYVEGKLYFAYLLPDFRHKIPKDIEEAMLSSKYKFPETENGQWAHITSGELDFYMGWVDYDNIMGYMDERNANNLIIGV